MLILKDNARGDEIYDRDIKAQARTCGIITRIRESHPRKAVFSLRRAIIIILIINPPASVAFCKISPREMSRKNVSTNRFPDLSDIIRFVLASSAQVYI